MSHFVAVAVNIPSSSDIYHYHLPDHLVRKVTPGHLVEIPFGKQITLGIVLAFIDQPAVPETRPISGLVDEKTVLTPAQIQLAQEISMKTLSPLAACLQLMLPPGLAKQTDTLFTVVNLPKTTLGSIQKRLVDLLQQRGPLRGRQIDHALPRTNWRSAAQSLLRRRILSKQSILPEPTIRPKTVRTAELTCSPETALAAMDDLGRQGTKALKRRQALLQFLIEEEGPVEAPWLYASSGGNLSDLKNLERRGLVQLGNAQVWRDPLIDLQYTPNRPLPLTSDQQAAWDTIRPSLSEPGRDQTNHRFLLHGVTGSGKTEIYLYAVAETLRKDRQAIVLVPEIAMTPQTVRRFVARFPGKVGLFHSGLSQGERFDTWQRIRMGEISIVVGPRSALFTPFTNLGLVIVDEFHDDTYYQSDPIPRYHAREVAFDYARITGAVCILGSATPDLVSKYRAEREGWTSLKLPRRILAHRQSVQKQMAYLNSQRTGKRNVPQSESRYRAISDEADAIDLPPVTVVDMRQELKAGNRSIFSRLLQSELQRNFEDGEQAILFLNRRGTATHVFCRDCGYTVKCPRCDIPLTYHGALKSTKKMLCHRCGYQRQMPTRCPDCKGNRIRQLGTGTERVEDDVRKLLPDARTLRWDYETTRQKGAHEILLNHFSNHQADILVGTQMVAKGLDLPWVTLVGVVLADSGLNLPDLRAAERTFQVLTQVAGRAGRSPLGGQVILQTFQPDHYIIQAAANHDYDQFYARELAYRRTLGYPPFSHLVRLEYRDQNAHKAKSTAQKTAKTIRSWVDQEHRRQTEIIGPAPCFFTRIDGYYRWQIIVRGPDPTAVLRTRVLSDWRIEVDPPSLL